VKGENVSDSGRERNGRDENARGSVSEKGNARESGKGKRERRKGKEKGGRRSAEIKSGGNVKSASAP